MDFNGIILVMNSFEINISDFDTNLSSRCDSRVTLLVLWLNLILHVPGKFDEIDANEPK